MNSGKKWIFVAFCLVFISGLFSGIIIERKCLHCHPSEKWEKGERFSRREPLDRITKDLSLNSEQREAVGKIFEKHRPEFEVLHKQVRNNLSKLLDQIDKEICSVLNDKQKKKYEMLMKERKKHHSESGTRHDDINVR